MKVKENEDAIAKKYIDHSSRSEIGYKSKKNNNLPLEESTNVNDNVGNGDNDNDDIELKVKENEDAIAKKYVDHNSSPETVYKSKENNNLLVKESTNVNDNVEDNDDDGTELKVKENEDAITKKYVDHNSSPKIGYKSKNNNLPVEESNNLLNRSKKALM